MPINIKTTLCSHDTLSTNHAVIHAVNVSQLTGFSDTLEGFEKNQVSTQTADEPKAGQTVHIVGQDGYLSKIIWLVDETISATFSPWPYAALKQALPAGDYSISVETFVQHGLDESALVLGWLLASYQFDDLKSEVPAVGVARLGVAVLEHFKAVIDEAEAIALGRDLINFPTNHMSPQHLEDATKKLADQFGATVSVISGDDLLTQNFPAIHAVGRAADVAPRLIDMRWGKADAPNLTLVGKGVCFDTGGLNLKTGNYMTLMKKDMGGAASVLAFAHMIMASGADVCLRVLIPAVENSVAGNAFRPGDVIDTRKGLTVEIGNTDAEGRLILCDALTFADEENPDLIIDMATLTGAARVALGPDLPPLYCRRDEDARALMDLGMQNGDPVWHMPLWADYEQNLSSDIADTNNVTSDGFAGSITAGLYLSKFVKPETNWMHLDVFGWSPSSRPGRPKGGHIMAVRTLFHALNKILK